MEEIKYLGIDWGSKRIGLAIGDGETKIALPFKTVANLDELLRVIKEEDIDSIVIGEPCSIDGIGKPSDTFNEFCDQLIKSAALPVYRVDERLSSKAADARSGRSGQSASRDEVAAMIILQSYLDSLNK